MDDRAFNDFAEPLPGLEQRIAALWQSFLPNARCGRHDRFEALGGDSLLAVAMLAAFAKSEGVEVPYETFVTHGTIAALAAQSEPTAGLFRLLRKPSDPAAGTMFCFPGHDGTLFGLTRMAGYLERGPAVFGFDLLQCEPADSIAQHARRALADILRLAPPGPLVLAGVCLGACIALEVAELLADAGRPAHQLILIDSINPAWVAAQMPLPRFFAGVRQWRHKLPYHLRHLRELGISRGSKYIAGRVRALLLNKAENRSPFRQAMLSWQPRPSSARPLIIRLPGRRLDAPALGWHAVFGNHCDMADLPFQPDSSLAGDSARRVAAVLNSRI